MKAQRKIWELQHQTVCKVIGMAFDLEDLQKIANMFGICQRDPLMDHEFALHSTVVHLSGTDNKVARHVQKVIEKRFARYARRLSNLEPRELIEWVTKGEGKSDIPLWALLWSLATRGLENGASLETCLFGFIHMLEHKLMREHWLSAEKRAEEQLRDSEGVEETTRLKRRILDLQADLERNIKMNEHLRAQISEQKAESARNMDFDKVQAPCVPVKIDQTEKVLRLQAILEDVRTEKQGLEEENTRLRKEIEVLTRELAQHPDALNVESREPLSFACPIHAFLKEKHVTMVGGISSLETHYRELVEAMGGTFRRHDGDCRGGECLIQDCVRKADLVVCPVEVNSHNAVKSVKKLCKNLGVPCCFPRTAGLTGFRLAIEEHFSECRVA